MGVRVSAAERARLEAKATAVGVPVTAFLRLAADGVVPRVVPEGNREQWGELAHLARTLGRLERAMAAMHTLVLPAEVAGQLDAFRPVVSALAGEVFALRNALLGRDPTGHPLRYPDDSPDLAAADDRALDVADGDLGLESELGPASGDARDVADAGVSRLVTPVRIDCPPAPPSESVLPLGDAAHASAQSSASHVALVTAPATHLAGTPGSGT